jgi:hypothetical protein
MEHTTFLQAIGNLIGLLIFIGIPLVLVIKNPQTTLSLIKAVFKLLVSAGKFIVPLIVSFIVWVSKIPTNNPKPYWPSSSDDGFSSEEETCAVTHDKTRWDYDHGIEKKYE